MIFDFDVRDGREQKKDFLSIKAFRKRTTRKNSDTARSKMCVRIVIPDEIMRQLSIEKLTEGTEAG